MREHQKNQRRMILFTAIVIIITLTLTLYLVINDMVKKEQEAAVDLSTPEATVTTLEDALAKNSYIMLDKVFYENHYSSVFGELFFDKIVSVSFGFSQDPNLNQKRIITSNDLPEIQKNEMKYLTDDAIMAILMIDEALDTAPGDLRKEAGAKNLLNVAFLMQRFDGEWKITKLYDFVSTDADFFEVKDFYLHYPSNAFKLELTLPEYEGFTRSTALYNLALQIRNISVVYEDRTLCSFGREQISVFLHDYQFTLKDDQLKNPDLLRIEGDCDYSSIINGDPEKKYLLYIVITTQEKEYLVRYYGDLLL